jgi:DNA polymerase-3 subunit delta
VSLKQFQQEIEKALPSPVYFIHSTEAFLLYEALNAVRGLFQDPALFNFEIIDLASPEEKLPAEKVIDILNTLPFLSSRKTVVLRNVQKWTKKEAQRFGDYLKRPSESSVLVMLCEGAASDVFDSSLMNGVKSIALSVTEREIPAWINEKAGQKGIKFTPAAIDYLITFAGTDLGMLHSEIEKFALGEAGHVLDVDEVRAVVYSGAEYGAFDLTNALARKDAAEVFRIYEKLERSLEPQMLLGALNWQYSGGARGRGPALDRKKLDKVFTLLHEADLAVKTSHSHVIEELLIKLLKI